jgi:hypothetical protein
MKVIRNFGRFLAGLNQDDRGFLGFKRSGRDRSSVVGNDEWLKMVEPAKR